MKFGGRGSLGIRGTVKAGTKTVELLIPSRADYQLMNAALAFRAAQVIDRDGRFKVSVKAAAAGIRTSRWPGRMEEVLPGVFLDGAHNEGGMEALARNIAAMQRESGKPVSLMFGVVGDKEYRKMIRKLCGQVDVSHVTVAQMDTERSVGAAVLAEEFRESLGCPVEAFDTVKDGWKCFLRNKGEGLAFCAGSLYLAGEVKALLDGYCLQGTSEQ